MSFICHIHNYTEYNKEWNVFSAFNPSKCTHTWSSGQPTLRCPGSSRGFSALLKGLPSVVDNSCRSRDSNPQPRVTSPTLYPLEPRMPPLTFIACVRACVRACAGVGVYVCRSCRFIVIIYWYYFLQLSCAATGSDSRFRSFRLIL